MQEKQQECLKPYQSLLGVKLEWKRLGFCCQGAKVFFDIASAHLAPFFFLVALEKLLL